MPTQDKAIDWDELERIAREATPGPWLGDRTDGTVKYDLLARGANGLVHVIRGDNGNVCENGCYGIQGANDERYLLTFHPETVLRLLQERRELREALKGLTDEFGGSLDQYHKLGPDWTHKDGTEVFEVSVLLDRAPLIEAGRALLSRTTAEQPSEAEEQVIPGVGP